MATATRTRMRDEVAVAPAFTQPRYLAFWLMRLVFFAAPIIAGVDKFFDRLVNWNDYLWSGIPNFLHMSAPQVMHIVGGIEIAAGILVLLVPRFGAPLVAAWLAGIVTNLLIVGAAENEYWDIALRDFGLMVGAISLTLLAWDFHRGRTNVARR